MKNIFAQLTKVDEGSRVVTGTMLLETVDRSREICDYATAKEQVQKWSTEQEEASGGLSKGNVRLMHGGDAVGLVKSIRYDDEAKKIDIDVEVVDDGAWQKVCKGVLTGFSIGGAYLRKWADAIKGVTRYTPLVKEVSLVDRPAMPGAYFQFAKADGTTENVKLRGDQGAIVQYWDCGVDDCGVKHMAKADAVECYSEVLEKAGRVLRQEHVAALTTASNGVKEAASQIDKVLTNAGVLQNEDAEKNDSPDELQKADVDAKGEDMKELEDLRKSVDDKHAELKKSFDTTTGALTKATGLIETLQKSFDAAKAENDELKKTIAKQGESIDVLTKAVARVVLPTKAVAGDTTVVKKGEGDDKLEKKDTHALMVDALKQPVATF